MKNKHFFPSFILTLSLLFAACGEEKHFITDEKYRAQVENDFTAKKALFENQEFFSVFKENLSLEEEEALKFLYAYMSMADIVNQEGDFYLKNIRYAQKAREEMPWGKIVPEREFRHFVLPVRVNNENLDNARQVFYEELKDRIKNLSLHDAVLEVNHWCHEKVTYTPTDRRTCSPLAVVKTATGRCGEQSTFTVSALRAVGIPARQVYTPRWAHTDSNHAWVEAWVDGKWHFFGACEPEAVLDLAWFNAPAGRGMLMQTKVFGPYDGPEEKLLYTANYTEINVTEIYAPVATIDVEVVDENGTNVVGAKVEYKLYNYGELSNIAVKQTDKAGKSSLLAGKGDIIIWVSKDGKFGFEKVSVGKTKEQKIVLNKKEGDAYSIELDIVPPIESTHALKLSDEQRNTNNRRLEYEDSLRHAYTATFMNVEQAKTFARQENIDESLSAELLVASKGNHETIKSFLSAAQKQGKATTALALLKELATKDLEDVNLEVLNDHLNYSINSENPDFNKYILNPRVEWEMLTPYKAFFQAELNKEEAEKFKANPQTLVEWCSNNILINEKLNSQNLSSSPVAVWKARITDKRSLELFFVSLARSLGIPAWKDKITGKVQYKNISNKVLDVDFVKVKEEKLAPTGILKATYSPTRFLANPQYYSHFTISKIEDGQLKLLNYSRATGGKEAATWSNSLKDGLTLDEGSYILLTGTRLASGAVLSNLSQFTIEQGKTSTLNLVMREDEQQVQVIGNFDSETQYSCLERNETRSILQTTGRGYFVVGILGVGQEPTNHALRALVAQAKELEAWGRPILLLFPNEEAHKKFKPSEFPGLPNTISYGIDEQGKIQTQIAKNMKLGENGRLPIFIVSDTFNRIVFVSQGYNTNMGEQLSKVVKGISTP